MFLKKLIINRSLFPTTDDYPFNLKVFQGTSALEFSKPVTFFSGENGSGKSTLLCAIARKWNIHLWNQNDFIPLKFNKYANYLSNCLDLKKTEEVPGAFFSAQNFRKFAELVDEWAKSDPAVLQYFGGGSLASRSHGQTNMQYFKNRFKVKGIYLLDEPEAALSPKSQLELMNIISECSQAGNAQFIIATHSPILLGLPDATILNFDQCPISPIRYEQTEYYRIYKDFLNNR